MPMHTVQGPMPMDTVRVKPQEACSVQPQDGTTGTTFPIVSVPSSTYQLALSKQMPRINFSLSVVHKLVSSRTEGYLTSFMVSYMKYREAIVFAVIALFAVSLRQDEGVFRIFLTAMAVPSIVVSVFSMVLLSVDPLAQLLRCYEFWFITVFNMAHWSVLAYILHDIRGIVCAAAFLGYQEMIMCDADTIVSRSKFRMIKLGVLFMLVFSILIWLRRIENICYFEVVGESKKLFDAGDVVVFTTSTLLIFVVKMIVSKQALRQHPELLGHVVVPCALLATVLKLVSTTELKDTSSIVPDGSNQNKALRQQTEPSIRLLVLRPFPLDQVDALNTVLPATWWYPLPYWFVSRQRMFCFAFHGLGASGYLLLVIHSVFTPDQLTAALQTTDLVIAIPGFTCSVIYCFAVFLLYERKLLRVVIIRFDFIFSSVQVGLFSVGLADMLLWDLASLLTLVAWTVWFHWALTLDALTPMIKHRIFRFRKRMAVPILAVLLVSCVTVLLEVVVNPDKIYKYHTLLQFGFSTAYVMEIRTEAIVLGRLLTIMLWTTRQAVLMYARGDDELNVIRGSVEYVVPSTWTANAVVPEPSSLGRSVAPAITQAFSKRESKEHAIAPTPVED